MMRKVICLLVGLVLLLSVSIAVAEENDCEHLNTEVKWGFDGKISMLGQMGTAYCIDCGREVAKVTVTSLSEPDVSSVPAAVEVVLIIVAISGATMVLCFFIEMKETMKRKNWYIKKKC